MQKYGILFYERKGDVLPPGDTIAPLNKLLIDSKIGIKLSKEIIYCMDNEAIRFLAAITQGKNVTFSASEKKNSKKVGLRQLI